MGNLRITPVRKRSQRLTTRHSLKKFKTRKERLREREHSDTKLKGGDDESTPISPLFSRACQICLAGNPLRRSAFDACGHLVCAACAEQISLDASEYGHGLACPSCRQRGDFVPLVERQIQMENRHGDDFDFELDPADFVEDDAVSDIEHSCVQSAYEAMRAASIALYDANQLAMQAEEDKQERELDSICGLVQDSVVAGAVQQAAAAEDALAVADGAYTAACAAFNDAANKEEAVEELFIEHLRMEAEESEKRGRRFSRMCSSCNEEPPLRRVICVGCSEAVCQACALARPLACPHCNIAGGYVLLYEEMIEN